MRIFHLNIKLKSKLWFEVIDMLSSLFSELKSLNIISRSIILFLFVVMPFLYSCTDDKPNTAKKISECDYYILDLEPKREGYIQVTYFPSTLYTDSSIYSLLHSDSLYTFGNNIFDIVALNKDFDTLKAIRNAVNDIIIPHSSELFSLQYKVKDSWTSRSDLYRPICDNIRENRVFLSPVNFIGSFIQNRASKVQLEIVDKKIDLKSQYVINNSKSENDSSHILEFQNYTQLYFTSFLYSRQSAKRFLFEGSVVYLTLSDNNDDSLICDTVSEQLLPIIETAFSNFLFNIDTLYINLVMHPVLHEEGMALPNTLNIVSPDLFSTKTNIELIQVVLAHEMLHLNIPLQVHNNQFRNNIFLQKKMTKHLWFDEGITEYLSLSLLLESGVIDSTDFKNRIGENLYYYNKYYKKLLDSLPITQYSEHAGDTLFKFNHAVFYTMGALYFYSMDYMLLKSGKDIHSLYDSIFYKFYENPYSDEAFLIYVKSISNEDVSSFIDSFIIDNNSFDFIKFLNDNNCNYSKEISSVSLPYIFYFNLYNGFIYKNDSLYLTTDKNRVLVRTINGIIATKSVLNKYLWQSQDEVIINKGFKDEQILSKKRFYRIIRYINHY